MENVFLTLINRELISITQPKYNKLISYGKSFDFKLVYSLTWLYKYYFGQSVILFLPKVVDIESTLEEFNKDVGEFILTTQEVCYCSLESMEYKDTGKVIIYGFADFIFNELVILNKKRINTLLKKSKNKIHVISYTNLKVLDIIAFDLFQVLELEQPVKFNFDYIDLIGESTECLIDFISENREQSIYMSLALPTSKILEIEKELKDIGVNVSRNESESNIVLHSSKNIHKSFLKCKYQIYIFITPLFEYPLDVLYYLKEIGKTEVNIFMDSSRLTNINESINKINCQENLSPRLLIKDSKSYESYNELIKDTINESCIVSEYYYCFEASEAITLFDLQNLSKREYDTIRNFVKLKLMNKLGIEVKTCQLSTPCSPNDRSKKLNSLSNKISSYDYRCDITCEIFKDYTIGVIVWNEMFANRKSFDIATLKNQIFIYQTTNGKWKFTNIT